MYMPNATGFASGEMQILCFASRKTQILAFSDTNMLVSPTQNSGVGGLSQRQGPTQLFCVAVEYRLNLSQLVEIPHTVSTIDTVCVFDIACGRGDAIG